MLSYNSLFAFPAPYTSLYLHHSTDCRRHHTASNYTSRVEWCGAERTVLSTPRQDISPHYAISHEFGAMVALSDSPLRRAIGTEIRYHICCIYVSGPS